MGREHASPAFTQEEALRQWLERMERRISILEKRTTHTIQQMSPDDIDDPIEGEEIIDPFDNKHKVYSNGQWRFCDTLN